jgi:drug/metabolite transporter (DMT)-like permease
MHLVWAGLFGWLVFDHIPDSLSVFGCVMIAASGAGLALKTRFSNRHTDGTDKASSRSQPDSLS